MTSEKPNPTPRIQVTQNGPYLVHGKLHITAQQITTDPDGIPIKWTTHAVYPANESCALCRCGNSAHKPFCDATHTKIGFNGAETAGKEAYLDRPVIVDGPALKLTDHVTLCASARFCHRSGGIWNLVPQSDKSQAKQTACEETADCPSGRLVMQDKANGETVEPAFEPSIVLVEDPAMGVSGPIWVRGNIPVQSAEGKPYCVRNRVTLCRCGKSQNKPFCDSSHYPDEEHEPHGDE